MEDLSVADFATKEGRDPFPVADGDDNSTPSPSETNDGNIDPAVDGDNNQQETSSSEDTNVPFNKHPRWQEREGEWKSRFNEQEERHQKDIKELNEKFSQFSKQPEVPEASEIPSWFGGNQEAWEGYLAHEQAKIDNAKEEAIKSISEAQRASDKLVEEANNYRSKEVDFITNDRALNPDSSKVDVNKLTKFVVDNNLVTPDGKWNYRLGWEFMQKGTVKQTTNTNDRKELAGATTSSKQKAEKKPANYMTSDDFKNPNNRAW